MPSAGEALMRASGFIVFLLLAARWNFAQEAPAEFRVKYVSRDVVYIGGGSASGLAEGMRLVVKRPVTGESAAMAAVTSELKIFSVASTSAACEIVRGDQLLQPGDIVIVHPDDAQKARETAEAREIAYAQVLEFTGADPLDQELREAVPKPPLAEINRPTGRIAFDHDFIVDRSLNRMNSTQNGVSLRVDLTRIGGSYWSLSGYWRTRLSSRQGPLPSETLRDVLQRVYQFGLRYGSPRSPYVAGIGRLLVPWASSLSTLDGGYLGRKYGHSTTIGLFAGTTPDPTSWNYNPGRQIGGVFAAFESGRFENVRRTSTVGFAVSRLSWRPDRQFLFSENNLTFRRDVRIQHDLEVDFQSSGRFASQKKVSLTRSFISVRLQPAARLSFDLNHNYFRVLPTFDPRLISTGLVDNALFQGISGSMRLELPYRLVPYVTLGTSRRNDDTRGSWNRTFGVLERVPRFNIRVDARYSNFVSTVGEGQYRAISMQKEIGESLRLELQAGNQRFASSLINATNSNFVMANTDWFTGRHFVWTFAGSRYRGGLQNYDQCLVQLGYRF
jgi:hypothetical protein